MSKTPRDRVPSKVSSSTPAAIPAAIPVAIDDVDLMQYLDGEADARTAEAVAAGLAGDADARGRLLAMEQMGDAVCTHLELAADDVEPRLDAMWATIERRIESNGAASTVSDAMMEAEAIPVAGKRVARRPAEREGFWAAIVEWFEAHQGHFVTGMVTAGAVAALVLLLRPPQEVIRERIVERPVAVSVPPERPDPGALAPGQGTAPRHGDDALVPVATPPRVESLEVTDGSGSVFMIPGEDANDVSTTVIWLDLDENDVEEPL